MNDPCEAVAGDTPALVVCYQIIADNAQLAVDACNATKDVRRRKKKIAKA
jgi:hypothetical protein